MLSNQHALQDIARSCYADMLNDDERNRAFYQAIDICVTHLVTSPESNPDGNRFFKCCDIGTGSGLLSMMVVKSFRRLNYANFHVDAFEAFEPMAQCALKVIEQNGMSQQITVIPTRSDLHKYEQNPQFDLLVAELLDTELIGEGCLEAYRHAIQNFCSPHCLFVPHAARIYAEPVASAWLFSRHRIRKYRTLLDVLGTTKDVTLDVDPKISYCAGMPEIDDMQASALREGEDFTRFSRPQVVFDFVFGNLETLKLSDHKKLRFPIEKKINEPPVVIMWWDISMFDSSLICCDSSNADSHGVISKGNHQGHSWVVLSCAPTWARSAEQLARDQFIKGTYGRDVWREHWIQGVYYFSSILETEASVGRCLGNMTIHAHHDAYSMWFDLKPCESRLPRTCDCGAHRKLSRSQLAFLSERGDMTKLIRSKLCMRYHEHSDSTGALENDKPILGSIEFVRQEGAIGDTVSTFSSASRWMLSLGSHGPEPVRLCDPALAGEVPWYDIMSGLLKFGKPSEPVESFKIKFTQVQFDNLNRIRTNIGECEGFDLSHLDDMINYSSKHVDKELEAHYLWEYPCTRIDSSDYTVFSSSHCLDGLVVSDEPCCQDEAHDKEQRERDKILSATYWRHFKLPIPSVQAQVLQGDNSNWQKGWALVFWAELKLEETRETLSLGPVSSHEQVCGITQQQQRPPAETPPDSSKLGEQIRWNRNCKQLVYFLHDHPIVAPQTAPRRAVDEQPCIHLDVGLDKGQLVVQRAVDYNTSPLKSKRRLLDLSSSSRDIVIDADEQQQ